MALNRVEYEGWPEAVQAGLGVKCRVKCHQLFSYIINYASDQVHCIPADK